MAATCMGLTLLSYFIVHVPEGDSALVRCLMSLAAIGATTFLALRNQAGQCNAPGTRSAPRSDA